MAYPSIELGNVLAPLLCGADEMQCGVFRRGAGQSMQAKSRRNPFAQSAVVTDHVCLGVADDPRDKTRLV